MGGLDAELSVDQTLETREVNEEDNDLTGTVGHLCLKGSVMEC